MLTQNNCMNLFQELADNEVDFTLTDIPYETVSRKDNGLRNLNKEQADIGTFQLIPFLEEILRVTRNSLVIFCGKEQFSTVYDFFAKQKGTVRPIVWEKTNPSPMNGQYVYLSGVELAVWFKKQGAKTFNAHCKNTVFRYPSGKRTFHPTQKNLKLFEELIKDNTNPGDLVFDPCAGSATTAIAAINTGRRWLCCEMYEDYYVAAKERIMSSYDIEQEELQVTKDFLKQFGYEVKVQKCSDRDAADTIATINGVSCTFEIKQDELWRFQKYHEYGIDFISYFQFKPGMSFDTRVHDPRDIDSFLNTINHDVSFKWGKVVYSSADVWIFYTKNPDGSYYHLAGYDFQRLKQEMNFFQFLKDHCRFARNSKKKADVSHDVFHSAVFFCPPNLLEQYKIGGSFFENDFKTV